MINSINNDGSMKGYDLDIIEKVSNNVSVPVVACGGAGDYTHFRDAIDAGAHAVSAGSLFVYHGPRKAVLINYPSREQIKEIRFND